MKCKLLVKPQQMVQNRHEKAWPHLHLPQVIGQKYQSISYPSRKYHTVCHLQHCNLLAMMCFVSHFFIHGSCMEHQGARRQPQRCPDLLRGCCLNGWQRSASPFPSARPGAMATLEDISMTLADGSSMNVNPHVFQKQNWIIWNHLESFVSSTTILMPLASCCSSMFGLQQDSPSI